MGMFIMDWNDFYYQIILINFSNLNTSAYHGHLTTLIDISPMKFLKIKGAKKKKWVHLVLI